MSSKQALTASYQNVPMWEKCGQRKLSF